MIPIILKITNIIIFVATIVDPIGVEKRIDERIPSRAHVTDITAEQITTPLKFLITRIADNAGNITKADINSDPTRFIANTIIIAVITAIRRL